VDPKGLRWLVSIHAQVRFRLVITKTRSSFRIEAEGFTWYVTLSDLNLRVIGDLCDRLVLEHSNLKQR
jgi:hypothetical protein